jgi:uncharacterized cupin superfamily protein
MRTSLPPVPDWFVVNVADAEALEHPVAGTIVPFEDREDRFPEFGIGIHILQPGQPNGKYHSETAQEDFLVLSGECIALIEGEEHHLRAWDFFHCPAGTEHIFVGAGDGPCAILMAGARPPGNKLHYPANEVAERYGAATPEPTEHSRVAYSDWDHEFQPTQLDWPL